MLDHLFIYHKGTSILHHFNELYTVINSDYGLMLFYLCIHSLYTIVQFTNEISTPDYTNEQILYFTCLLNILLIISCCDIYTIHMAL